MRESANTRARGGRVAPKRAIVKKAAPKKRPVRVLPAKKAKVVVAAKKAVWYWKSNPNPWDDNEIASWTAYPKDVSDTIEDAYKRR
jgi:hypothetical protein